MSDIHTAPSKAIKVLDYFPKENIITPEEVYKKLKLYEVYPDGVYNDYRSFFETKKIEINPYRLKVEANNAFVMPIFNWSLRELEKLSQNLPVRITYQQPDLKEKIESRKIPTGNWYLVSKESGISQKPRIVASSTARVVCAAMIAYVTRKENILKKLSFCSESFSIFDGDGEYTHVKALEQKGPNGGNDKELNIVITGITKLCKGGRDNTLCIES